MYIIKAFATENNKTCWILSTLNQQSHQYCNGRIRSNHIKNKLAILMAGVVDGGGVLKHSRAYISVFTVLTVEKA